MRDMTHKCATWLIRTHWPWSSGIGGRGLVMSTLHLALWALIIQASRVGSLHRTSLTAWLHLGWWGRGRGREKENLSGRGRNRERESARATVRARARDTERETERAHARAHERKRDRGSGRARARERERGWARRISAVYRYECRPTWHVFDDFFFETPSSNVQFGTPQKFVWINNLSSPGQDFADSPRANVTADTHAEEREKKKGGKKVFPAVHKFWEWRKWYTWGLVGLGGVDLMRCTRSCVCTRIWTCICMYACKYVHTHSQHRAHISRCYMNWRKIKLEKCVYTISFVYIYICIYTYKYICIYTAYIHIHTYI